jgi:hypothetical protein
VIVSLAFILWPLIVVGCYLWMKPHKAILATFIGGWLFLPVAQFQIPGFPDYGKTQSVSLVAFICGLLISPWPLLRLKFQWPDVVVWLICLSPLLSSIANGLGLYNGMSGVLLYGIMFAIPYYLGRAYFGDPEILKDVLMAIFIGGLLYAPFCLFEMRMSPHLHKFIYGYHPHSFAQHIRQGGYRPMVFMNHGIMVAIWMSVAAIGGICLWLRGHMKSMQSIPGWAWVVSLVLVAILCKSLFALALLLIGSSCVVLGNTLRTKYLLVAFLLMFPSYVVTRAVLDQNALPIIKLLEPLSASGASSMKARVMSEGPILRNLKKSPLFGWGSTAKLRPKTDGRNDFAIDESGKRYAIVVEAGWLRQLGLYGWAGFVPWMLLYLAPGILLFLYLPREAWFGAEWSLLPGLVIMINVFLCDNLMNEMYSPIYVLLVGVGIASVYTCRRNKALVQFVPLNDSPLLAGPDLCSEFAVDEY